MLVEQILHQPEQLDILCQLVGGVHVDHPIGRHLRVLVGIVVDQILAADDVEIGAELPGVGDLVFGPGLEAVTRNARDMVARRDENVAGQRGVRVLHRGRIVRGLQCQRTLICGVDIGVVGVRGPAVLLVVDFCLDPLPQRRAGVLEIAEHRHHGAGNIDDVVGVLGAEHAKAPAQLPAVVDGGADAFFLGHQRGRARAPERVLSSQPRLIGVRHHLLERRIGDQEIIDLTGVRWVRASKLERRRRAVRFRIARIGRDVRSDLVGRPDHRVEPRVLVAAVEQGVQAGLVLQLDLGQVVTATCRDRELRCHVERVGRIDAQISVNGQQVGRLDIV